MYQQKGVTCENCHGAQTPTSPATDAACHACHGLTRTLQPERWSAPTRLRHIWARPTARSAQGAFALDTLLQRLPSIPKPRYAVGKRGLTWQLVC
ncbi:cytochrome c3 family protein [Afifella sp. JA880]|uniref:cytochrome c3 family protein n=1 Tax=Afifella sp. JA880 TaxID=2975280 RepID=UPI0039648921